MPKKTFQGELFYGFWFNIKIEETEKCLVKINSKFQNFYQFL